MVAITLVAGAAVFGFVNSQSGISAQAVGNSAAANINFLNEREVIVFAQVTGSSPSSTANVWVYNPGAMNPLTVQSALVIPLGVSGTATSGGSLTLSDSTRNWNANYWAGFTVAITGGTGAGQSGIILSNTATVLTVTTTWSTAPDSTSTYAISPGTPILCAISGSATVTLYSTAQVAVICPGHPFVAGLPPTQNSYIIEVVGKYGTTSQLTVAY